MVLSIIKHNYELLSLERIRIWESKIMPLNPNQIKFGSITLVIRQQYTSTVLFRGNLLMKNQASIFTPETGDSYNPEFT